jgi:hypothetical protein
MMAKAPSTSAKSDHETAAPPTEKLKTVKAIAAKPKTPKATAAPPSHTGKATKAKAKVDTKSVLKHSSETISKLASDILADRIVPTIEQIKTIAASALGHDNAGSKKKKKKQKGK